MMIYNYAILKSYHTFDIHCVISNLPLDFKICTHKQEEEYKKHRKIFEEWFEKGWFGVGAFNGGYLIGYCFIKHPKTRPETLTQVHEIYRSQGVAVNLRDFAFSHRNQFEGNIVYSAVELNNPASIKSLLNSGYQVFDITKDGYLQFVKILSL